MVLSAIVPEQWLYGFLATVMTQNLYTGFALYAGIFLNLTWLHWHRNDPSPLDIHVHLTQSGSAAMGALVGMFFVAFFRSPRFVDARMYNTRGQFKPWFLFVVLLTVAATAGVYRLEAGDIGLGLGLLIPAALLLLLILGFGYWSAEWVRDGPVQLKYLLLFAITAVIPAANDYPLSIDGIMGPQTIRPWNNFIWAGAWFVALAIFYYFTVLAEVSKTERKWWKEPATKGVRWHSPRVFVTALFLAIAIVYVSSLIADEIGFAQFGAPGTPLEEEQKIWYTLIATGVGSGVILIALALMWWYEKMEAYRLESGVNAGAGTRSKDIVMYKGRMEVELGLRDNAGN